MLVRQNVSLSLLDNIQIDSKSVRNNSQNNVNEALFNPLSRSISKVEDTVAYLPHNEESHFTYVSVM